MGACRFPPRLVNHSKGTRNAAGERPFLRAQWRPPTPRSESRSFNQIGRPIRTGHTKHPQLPPASSLQMPFPFARLVRLAAGLTATLFAALPVSSVVRPSPTRTDLASGGVVAKELSPRAADEARAKAAVRRQLTEHGVGTYIGEMLAERDSALARWHDLKGVPLKVWIQPESRVDQWRPSYSMRVRDAFLEWDSLALPVRFAFTSDSANADVHVTFIDHFEEPISGRTKWARDDDWWIIDGDIVLAVHHRSGRTLDDEAMKAMALHEAGHLLGLDHTEDQSSIMAPRVRVRALSPADRATVRLLYTLPPGGVR